VTASVAQLDRAGGFYPPGCGFDSCRGHKSGVLAVDVGAGRTAARATVLTGLVDNAVGGVGRRKGHGPLTARDVGGKDVDLQANGVGTVPHVTGLGLEGLVAAGCFHASEHCSVPGALYERIDRLPVVQPISAGGCNNSAEELDPSRSRFALSRSSKEADDWAAFTAASPPPGRPDPHSGVKRRMSPVPGQTLYTGRPI
jgi:hypothetical protein